MLTKKNSMKKDEKINVSANTSKKETGLCKVRYQKGKEKGVKRPLRLSPEKKVKSEGGRNIRAAKHQSTEKRFKDQSTPG